MRQILSASDQRTTETGPPHQVPLHGGRCETQQRSSTDKVAMKLSRFAKLCLSYQLLVLVLMMHIPQATGFWSYCMSGWYSDGGYDCNPYQGNAYAG